VKKGGELMRDVLIVLQAMLKVVKYFFPAVLAFIIGLGTIAHDERRDKRGRSPRNQRPA
jgi:hypothetical protein